MNIYLILCAIISLISIPYTGYKVKNSKSYRRRYRHRISDSDLKTSDFSEISLNSQGKKNPPEIQKMMIKAGQMGDKNTLLDMRKQKTNYPKYNFKTYITKTEKDGKKAYEGRDWTTHKKIWDRDKLGSKKKSKPKKTKKK